jgi:arabinogalactan endo-1,4-beta-galactosidase
MTGHFSGEFMKKSYTLFLVCCFLLISPAFSRTEPFILGADISWIDQRESEGVKYVDNGTVKDIFEIMKEHKFNWIRLRLFVDPTAKVSGATESPYSAKGFCDLEHTRKMAKRAKAAGFKLLLDFHYSDVWADPAKQFKPVSWAGLSFVEIKAKVRSYTKETLELLRTDGTLPDMVQVGNEVVGGMIWPDGKSSNMTNFAALVNSGIDGVKDVSPDIKIMIHSISENSPSAWLKSLISAGVKRIDVFGLSYYSKWHGRTENKA